MKRILVVGSINYDVALKVDRLPEKSSNILAKKVERVLGGKGANLAVACHKLGLEVAFYAKIGNDSEGQFLMEELEKYGMNVEEIVINDKYPTGKAFICVDEEANNFIVVEKGANYSFDSNDENKLDELIQAYDMILIQLEINFEIIEKIISLSKKYNKKLIIDAGPIVDIDYKMFSGAYIVSPNETELENLVGRKIINFDDVKEACVELNENGIENIIVKLGNKGSYFYSGNEEYFQKSYSVKSVDSTAAGDSFMAGLSLGLLKGKNIIESLDLASKCGAIATTKFGASTSLPTIEDLENFRSRYEIN